MTILDWTNLHRKYISDIGGSNSYTNLDILRCEY